jgi:hypothetical protein
MHAGGFFIGRDGVLRRPRPRSSGRNKITPDDLFTPQIAPQIRAADAASAVSLPAKSIKKRRILPCETDDSPFQELKLLLQFAKESRNTYST